MNVLKKFNLSYSSYNTFKESPLQFYFQKINDLKPTDWVPDVYGMLGNNLHDGMEERIKDRNFDSENLFIERWFTQNIDSKKGVYNTKPKQKVYLDMVKLGVKYIDDIRKKYDEIIPELRFDFDFHGVHVKGFIDVVCKKNDEIFLLDWKSDSTSEYEKAKLQRLFYSWAYYKVYGIIPKECKWVYLRKFDIRNDSFKLEDLNKFEERLKKDIDDIESYGFDIHKYPIGDFNNIFNGYKTLCIKEKEFREDSKEITVTIKNNKLWFEGLNETLKDLFDKKYFYMVPGYNWSQKFKKRLWDGKKHFLKKDTLPLGFIHNAEEFINDYNKRFGKNYTLKYVDERNQDVMNKVFDTKFVDSDKTLYEFQEDTVQKALEKKIGILALATGLGKTFVASEIIRRLNKRTLFIVNRLELVEQTSEMFEEELGVEVGKMSEGNICIDKQIVVASIQTIYSIMKNRKDESKILRTYLYNTPVCIYDECHGVSESSFYDVLRKYLLNCEYFIGLSGSPFRADDTTLSMNSVVGFPIVTFDTQYGEDNGYLCPTKTRFVRNNMDSITGDYHEVYKELIVHNDERNDTIKKICDVHKGKKILILTKAIEHANVLQKLIPDSKIINSSVKFKTRKQDMKDFKKDEYDIMIAGIKIAGTGLNIPNLDVLIIAAAHKSAVDSVQTIGRVKRMFPGKTCGYLYDFYDSGYFYKATSERMSIIRKYGNEIIVIDKNEIK